MISVQDRLNSQAHVQEGHLLWVGSTNNDGYGYIWADGKLEAVHRMAWEIAYGPIPKSIQVNHLCDTPPCILPWHLYLGTHADNMKDRKANTTHCPRGHPYDDKNTHINKEGSRCCRACNKANSRMWRLLYLATAPLI